MGAMIEAIMKDPTLTHEQKLAAVAGLRQRKVAEAKAIRRKIIDEEKAKLKARRKQRGGSGKAPAPPKPTVH